MDNNHKLTFSSLSLEPLHRNLKTGDGTPSFFNPLNRFQYVGRHLWSKFSSVRPGVSDTGTYYGTSHYS